MSTQAAQRRLLEALAAQDRTPGGIAGLRLSLPYAASIADQAGQPALADVWHALDALAAAVQNDRKGVSHG